MEKLVERKNCQNLNIYIRIIAETNPRKERKWDGFPLDNGMKKIGTFLLHFNQSKRGIESTVRVLIKNQIFFQLWYTLYFIKFLRTAAHYFEMDLYEFNREWLKRLAIYAVRDSLTINLLMRPVNDLNSMKLYLPDVRAAARTRITQRTITHAYVRVLFCRTHVLSVSSTVNLVTYRIRIVPSSFSSLRENRLERREVWLIRLSRRRNRLLRSFDCLCSTMNHPTSRRSSRRDENDEGTIPILSVTRCQRKLVEQDRTCTAE